MGQNYWSRVLSSSDGSGLAAINTSGSIYISSNGGSTWAESMSDESSDWYGISATSDNSMFAAVAMNNSNVYISKDGGLTWNGTSIGLTLRDVVLSTDGLRMALLGIDPYYGTGYILTSSNSGETWITRSIAGEKKWNRITSSSDGELILATAYNRLVS